jgi:hypothetical protein
VKIMSSVLAVMLTCTVCAQKSNQSAKDDDIEKRNSFATRWEVSKGGIGLISKNLHVVVKSRRDERNELMVSATGKADEDWYGKNVSESEVAIFYKGTVYSSSQGLPTDFDLSKAVVVSFESKKVRFFDFQTEFGGFYYRIRD